MILSNNPIRTLNRQYESCYSIKELAQHYCVSVSVMFDTLVDMNMCDSKTYRPTKHAQDENLVRLFSAFETSILNPYRHQTPLENIYFNQEITAHITEKIKTNPYFKVGYIIKHLSKVNSIYLLPNLTPQEKSLKFKMIYVSHHIYIKNKEDKKFILNLKERLEETELLELSSKIRFFNDLTTRYNNYKLEETLKAKPDWTYIKNNKI